MTLEPSSESVPTLRLPTSESSPLTSLPQLFLEMTLVRSVPVLPLMLLLFSNIIIIMIVETILNQINSLTNYPVTTNNYLDYTLLRVVQRAA